MHLLLLYLLFPISAFASGASHEDPAASVILWVTLIYFFAIIGRYLARRLNQPGVMGELLMGVFLGNVCYAMSMPLFTVLREGSAVFNIMRDVLSGTSLSNAVSLTMPNPFYAQQMLSALTSINGVDYMKIAYVVDIFARYGVIFLLFKVGLESSIEELKHTGKASMKVAIIGVIVPIILGAGAAHLMMPDASFHSDLFVAATLCATSVGITASVLSEMKKLGTREAQTILGAAVIDDILGLIILAIVSSIVISGHIEMMSVLQIIMMTLVFFAGAILLGPWLLKKAVYFFRFLELWEAKLFISFIFVMTLSWLATKVQLATIIGAFAAGLILHDGLFKSRDIEHVSSVRISHLIGPIESILAPLFFMLIGIQVKIETFFHPAVILLAFGLIVAAILGKIVSGFGAEKGDDKWVIGLGMMPRGEVGIVFASIGKTLGVISDQLFSAIILMVIVTTLIAPPLIKARFAKLV